MDATLLVRMTAANKKLLQVAARTKRTSMSELVRQAAVAAAERAIVEAAVAAKPGG